MDAAILGGLGSTGIFGSISRGASYEGSTIVQDDLTIIMGRHSIKTGFEGRFYYVDNDTRRRDGHLQLQSGAVEPAGIRSADRPCLRELSPRRRATSSRPVQAVSTDYYQREFRLLRAGRLQGLVEADAEPGVRWQIIPGFYEKNGYVTNLDLTLPNAGGGQPCRAPCASPIRKAGRRSSTRTTKRCSRVWAWPTRCRRRWPSAAGYSSSNRPATAYSDGEEFGGLNATGYNGSIAVNRNTRPTPNAQDPVMFLNDPYPSFAGHAPELRPDAAEQPGRHRLITGDEAKREQYHNFNVTVRRQLPANFSTTIAYIGAQGRELPFDLLDWLRQQPDQPHPVRRGRAIRRPVVQQSLEPAAARYPAAVSRLRRHGAAGAAAVPAVHERHLSEQLPGQDSVQLAADDSRASFQ